MSEPDPARPSVSRAASPTRGDPPWERELIERLVLGSLAERRRARRWKWAFWLFFLAVTAGFAVLLADPEWPGAGPSGPHSALVDVRGVIGAPGGDGAERVVAGLRAAFEDSGTAGVILRINSPGGSPVQAGYINDEILRLRGLHPETPLYAVVTDMAASGGYYIAAAADEIYASRSSIVGSIGVRIDGFGFVEALGKLGVERRLITAGDDKGFLDPFSPAREEDLTHARALLREVHDHFIDAVKRGRGDRLADDERVFSGMIWTGARAIELGLVDALGSSGYVAREVIGAEDIVDFTLRPSRFDTIIEHLGAGVARALGAGLGLGTARLY